MFSRISFCAILKAVPVHDLVAVFTNLIGGFPFESIGFVFAFVRIYHLFDTVIVQVLFVEKEKESDIPCMKLWIIQIFYFKNLKQS